MNIVIDITRDNTMHRTLDNIRIAFAIVGIFVFLGFVGAGLWHLFELATGYTEGLFRMAGY
jgi:hypothetical protein